MIFSVYLYALGNGRFDMKLSTKFYLCLCNLLTLYVAINFATPEPEDDDPFYVVFNASIEANNISYFLNTKKNPLYAQRIDMSDPDTLKNSYFQKTKPVVFIVHGWVGHARSEMNDLVKNSYLKSHDVNVISPDWSSDAKYEYPESAKYAPSVGRKMSPFLDWLIQNGVSASKFHVIGYSLGAHVMAAAVRHVKRGKIGYATGLDPAKKYWKHSPERLDKLDAEYVEIIHTNTNYYGLTGPFGHNDFYPNGGELMPGAPEDIESHSKSYRYFAESVEKGGFSADQCTNYEQIVEDRCSNMSQLAMGGAHPKVHRGVFHLTTNAWSPYSQN